MTRLCIPKVLRNPLKVTRTKKFSRVVGYKGNIAKSTVFLYGSNEQTENELKEAIPFTIVAKRIT